MIDSLVRALVYGMFASFALIPIVGAIGLVWGVVRNA